jgi:hypothetical protein
MVCRLARTKEKATVTPPSRSWRVAWGWEKSDGPAAVLPGAGKLLLRKSGAGRLRAGLVLLAWGAAPEPKDSNKSSV